MSDAQDTEDCFESAKNCVEDVEDAVKCVQNKKKSEVGKVKSPSKNSLSFIETIKMKYWMSMAPFDRHQLKFIDQCRTISEEK